MTEHHHPPFTVGYDAGRIRAGWRGYYKSLGGARLGAAGMKRQIVARPWHYSLPPADARVVIRDASNQVVHSEPFWPDD